MGRRISGHGGLFLPQCSGAHLAAGAFCKAVAPEEEQRKSILPGQLSSVNKHQEIGSCVGSVCELFLIEIAGLKIYSKGLTAVMSVSKTRSDFRRKDFL